jgi:hypothetical protein
LKTKNFVLAVAGLLGCLLLNGCVVVAGPPQTSFFQEGLARHRANQPVRESQLPPTPVRRSSTYITTGTGGYSYYHSQGTDTYVSKYYDYYNGSPRKEYRQNTWNTTSENYYPTRYVPQMIDNPSGPKSRHVQGYVPLVPKVPKK